MNDLPEDPYSQPPYEPNVDDPFSSVRRKRNILRRSVFISLMLVTCALVLLGAFSAGGVLHLFQGGSTSPVEHATVTSSSGGSTPTPVGDQRTVLQVSSHPTVVINSETNSTSSFENNDKAPIHIHAVDGGQEIVLTATGASDLDNASSGAVVYERVPDGSTTIVWVKYGYVGTIDVAVPRVSDIKVTTLSGSVGVRDLTGQMVLQTNDGNISVQSSTLMGPSFLYSNRGEVKVQQSVLDGSVMLKNLSGPVTFNGRLHAGGNYRLVDGSGSMDVTLSSEDAFHLDAVDNTGSIVTTFPGISGSSTEVHGDVGQSSDRAQVSLSNSTGSIKIQKA